MSLRIEYTLGEHGWARLRIDHDGRTVETDVSYLEDSIPALARIALAGVSPSTPRTNAWVDFADEPGGVRVLFEPLLAEPLERRPPPSDQLVNVRYEAIEADDSRTPLFEGTTTAAELAIVVLGLLEGLYDQFGIVEYQRRWIDGEFPVAEMVRLRHALGFPLAERLLW